MTLVEYEGPRKQMFPASSCSTHSFLTCEVESSAPRVPADQSRVAAQLRVRSIPAALVWQLECLKLGGHAIEDQEDPENLHCEP